MVMSWLRRGWRSEKLRSRSDSTVSLFRFLSVSRSFIVQLEGVKDHVGTSGMLATVMPIWTFPVRLSIRFLLCSMGGSLARSGMHHGMIRMIRIFPSKRAMVYNAFFVC
jgi:hypothetical protein